jgi:hypothetical protein
MKYRCNDCYHHDEWNGSDLYRPRCRKCQSPNTYIFTGLELNEIALKENQEVKKSKKLNELHKRVNSLSSKDLVIGGALTFLTWQFFSLYQKVEEIEKQLELLLKAVGG